jgi:hypothetical protein
MKLLMATLEQGKKWLFFKQMENSTWRIRTTLVMREISGSQEESSIQQGQ